MVFATTFVAVKIQDFGGLQAVRQWRSASVKVCLLLSTDQLLPGTSLLCHFRDSQYVSFLYSENASWHLVLLHFHRKLYDWNSTVPTETQK